MSDPETTMSSDFEWHLDRGERFAAVFDQYDVQGAKRLIVEHPRPVQPIELSRDGHLTREGRSLKEALDEDVRIKPDADWSTIDARFPVIVGMEDGGRLILDGWHRIKKALDESADSIPAVYLTEEETKQIHLSGPSAAQ